MSKLIYGGLITTPNGEPAQFFQDFLVQFVKLIDEFENVGENIKPFRKLVQEDDKQAITYLVYSINFILSNKLDFEPIAQFTVMRILKSLMETFHQPFIDEVEKVMIETIYNIALFKKESSNENRGSQYFCYETVDNSDLKYIGIQLLKIILESVQAWASWFKGTQFEETYKKLTNQGVRFPTNFIYYKPIMMSYSIDAIKEEQKKVIQKYEPILPNKEANAAADDKKDKEKEKEKDKEKGEKVDKAEKADKVEKTDKAEKIDKWTQQIVVVPEESKTAVQKLQDKINQQNEDKWSYKTLKSKWGCLNMAFNDYYNYEYQFEKKDYYKKYQFVKHSQKLIEQGFCKEPYCYVNVPIRILVYRTLLNNYDNDYLTLFDDLIMPVATSMFKYQQNINKENQDKGQEILRFMKRNQQYASNFFLELGNVLGLYSITFSEQNYSQVFMNTMNRLKETNSLINVNISESNANFYRKRYLESVEGRQKKMKEIYGDTPNLQNIEECYRAYKSKFQFKRKMQILQNKFITFQYFEIPMQKRSDDYFKYGNFALSKRKKHIIYFKVSSINEVFKVLEEKESQNFPLYDKELRFVLSKVQVEYKEKYDKQNITLSRMSFKNCSTALITNFIMKNCEEIVQLPKSVEIINCSISDQELSEVIKHIDKIRNKQLLPYHYPAINMKWLVEGCRHLSYSFLENFNHSVEKWNFLQEHFQSSNKSIFYKDAINRIGLNIAIRNSSNFKSQDFLKFSTFESIRGSRGIKLKKIEGENMDQVMGYILQNRLVYTQDEVFTSQEMYQCVLKGISFDSSVCKNFDDLTLYEEYFCNVKKIRFKCTSSTKQQITFSKMRAYSLNSLEVLKLKNCILPSEFFINLSKMQCISTLKLINFKNSQFDPNDLLRFLATNKLSSLEDIDLSQTQIDDNVCYTLYNVFGNSNKLKVLNISNNQTKKLSHKGIKYLSYITSLEVLDISHCSHAVNDTLSPYIVDLLRRKNNSLKEKYGKVVDVEIVKVQNYLNQETYNCDELIKQLELDIEEVYKALQEIYKIQASVKQKVDEYDYEDFYNPNDSNLYLNIREHQLGEYKKYILEGIQVLRAKQAQNESINKPIQERLKALQDKKTTFSPVCHLESIDLSGNKHITSIFFEEFTKTNYLERLFYLNLAKTSVCGQIFTYLQNFDSLKLVKGSSLYKQNSFLKQGTLEDIDSPLQKISEEKIGSEVSNKLGEEEAVDKSNGKEINIQEKKDEVEEDIFKKVEENKDNTPMNSPKNKKQTSEGFKEAIVPLNKRKESRNLTVMSQVFKTVNAFLEVLILSSCKNIKANKFLNLFSTVFINLYELNLHDCVYFDLEFEHFINNKSRCFNKLKTINLQYSNVTNENLWRFLIDDEGLLEIYIDYTNFSQNPLLANRIEPSQTNQQKARQKMGEIKKSQTKKINDDKLLLPNVFWFSTIGCKLYNDKHLLEILEQIKSPIFDFNYFLSNNSHLITKKLVYYLVKDYEQMKNYFYFNLSGAPLPDIEESEKYQEEVLYFYQKVFKNFQKNKTKHNANVEGSFLETFIFDNSRINYRLFTKILKYHPSVKYISCLNTPYLFPISVEHKKKNSEDLLSIDQLMFLINQKNIQLSERNLEEIFAQIQKIKQGDNKKSSKSRRLHKLNLNGNQQLSPQNIDQLISSLFPYINALHLQYTRVDSSTIMQIIEKGQNIELINMKGCIHLPKEVLISICKCKNLSKNFRLECILELKHLIDYEVLTCLAQSKYMTNILYLDLSDIQVPNMDDCIMSICFIAQDISINLRIINVENTLISDRGFQMISVSQKFRNLERIYFQNCPLITERGISFIVDSNNLTRFDLSHFLNQNSWLLNGRIVDTLKYSNRKVFFREIDFQQSLISDKQLQKLMNETLTNTFNVKMFDFRFTPNLTRESIKFVYSIYSRGTRKKQLEGNKKNEEESENKTSNLQIVLFDEKRNQPILNNGVNYIDIFTKILDLQDPNKDNEALELQIQASNSKQNKQNNPSTPQAGNKQTTNNNSQKSQFAAPVAGAAVTQTQKKAANTMVQTYEENEINRWKGYILRDNADNSQLFEEELKKDMFLVDIFLYHKNLILFRYDYFIYKHKELINDNILTAFSLIKFICQKKIYQKNIIDQNSQSTDKENNNTEAASLTESLKLMTLLNSSQLGFIDLSYNKSLSETSLCRFFLNCQILSQVKVINLSGTNASEKVIDSILASKYLSQLTFIQLDDCLEIKDMNLILTKIIDDYEKQLKQNPQKQYSLDLKKILDYYISSIKDETLQKYLKYFNEKKIKVECLNLDSSQVDGIFFKYGDCFSKLRLINFSNTYLNLSYLNVLASQKNSIKTIWIDKTHMMTDQIIYHSISIGEFTLLNDYPSSQNLKKFRIDEFLYSKGPELNKSLSLFMKKILPHFKSDHLNLNNFPQIDPILLVEILTHLTIIQRFKQISLNFYLPSQIPAFKNLTRIIYEVCASGDLFCFRIQQISLQYQIDFNQHLELIKSQITNQQVSEEEQFNHIKEKAIVDSKLTLSFPFIPFGMQGKTQSQDIYLNYFNYVYQPFQFNEINLSNVLIERKTYRSLMKWLRKGNFLIKLNLHNNSQIYDQDIIKYLVKPDNQNQFCFKYLENLDVLSTNVTQRSLTKILQECPFSRNFNITELLHNYVMNQIANPTNALNNETIEYLSESPYLLNIKILDLKQIQISDNLLQKLFYSKYAVNIEKIILNYQYVSNSTFISLASTKKLPLLKSFHVDNEEINCKSHLHYLLRAKNLHFDLDMSSIIYDNNFMFQQENFVMSMIESIYMIKQRTLVMKSIQENIDNINQLFKLSPYLQNIQTINITSLDDRSSFYPVWINLARTDKLPNLIELSIQKVSVEHLKILLVQENKPKLDLSKLLYDNGEVVDDECLQILANQPNLLNMEVLDLSSIRISKLFNKIIQIDLLELALSKYVCNVKRIIIYEDQEKVERVNIQKLDDKVNKKLNKHKKQYEIYEQNGEEMSVNKDEEKKHLTKYVGLYEDMLLYNNFFNLEMIEFKRIECVHPLYVLYTAHRSRKRFYSPKFNLDEFFTQISNFYFDESISDYITSLRGSISVIFKIYFDIDKSWYSRRHKIIKYSAFQQFLSSFTSRILNKLENYHLVEEIHIRLNDQYYEFLQYLRSPLSNKSLLNLKKIVLDTETQSQFMYDSGYYQGSLKNLKSSIESETFQISPFFYKIILPLRQAQITTQEMFQLTLTSSRAFGFMKDIILFLEELEPSFINQLFEQEKEFKCRQLILKRHSNSSEAKEDSLKTIQDIIINQIINKKSMQQIRRFKPVQSITWKQFCDLLNCDFFHSSVKIFDFIKQYVDISDKLRPKLAEALQLKSYRHYFNLEELVIPHFDTDVQTTDSKLVLFQIHQMRNLKELKIQCPVNIEDMEYLFRVVYPLNKKIDISILNISDEVLLSAFMPPKVIKILPQSTKTNLPASEKIENVEENEQNQQKAEENAVVVKEYKMLDYTNDEKGRDWTEVCKFMKTQIDQLDELKQFNLFENINQNSSRYYLNLLGLNQSIIFNKELSRLNVNKIYLPIIYIAENKNTAQIETFMKKVDTINYVFISKDIDFNFNHLLKIHDQLQSTQIYELIFEHSSQLINNLDLLDMKDSFLENMLYLCFKKNKFILNDKTIEAIHYQKKRFFLDESGTQKKAKKKKLAMKQGSQQEIEEIQQKEEDEGDVDAAEEIEQQQDEVDGSDSDSDKGNKNDLIVGKKENAVTKGNQQNNLAEVEDEQRINDEDLMDQKKWISKENLANFISKFKKLKRINFGETEISAEHFSQISFNNLPFQLEHIDLDNCKVQNPTIFLTNYLQNFENSKEGKGEPRLQLQRFISQIAFTNNFPSNLEFVKELVDSAYFKDHVKYLNIFNLIKLHEQNGKELMKILQQILKRGDNKFCITSFLIMLGDIRNKLSDQEFDIISRSYTQIQYLSPFIFNNVNYGFNYIIQHASVSPKSKVMYFLNTNFQKNLSGLSFYEILYLLFDEQQLLQNQIIFEKFSDTVENELENLEEQIIQLQKILESFIEYQIGINNNFYSQLISYMKEFDALTNQSQPVEVKAKVSHLYSVLKKFEEKYLVIASIYDNMMINKMSTTQGASTMQKSSQSRIRVSKYLTVSQLGKGQSKNSKLAIKNLEERGLSEKKLQQQERQIIQTIQYITQLCLKMRESFDYFELSVLLEFVENLNLGNNTFLNFKGFNNYVKNHISPWLAMNQGIQKLKEPQNMNSKLDLSIYNMKKLVKQSIQDDEEDIENAKKRNNLENLIEADNELDDKIFDHLCFFIQKKMKGLRVINLSGVNVSDSFAEKFSLILSDEDQLRNLVKIDLTNNKRLSAFGMKYLYSTIVDRIPKGFRLELSSTFSEVQLLKDRVEALEKKLDNLDERKNKSSSAIIQHNQELKAKKKKKNQGKDSKKQTAGDEAEIPIDGLDGLYDAGSGNKLNAQKTKQQQPQQLQTTTNNPVEATEKKIEDKELNSLVIYQLMK